MIPVIRRYKTPSAITKIYNKSVSTQRHLAGLMEQLETDMAYLESVLLEIELAGSLDELLETHRGVGKGRSADRKSRQKRPQPKIKASRANSSLQTASTILAGRNNRQNDRLTLKDANRSDLWLHSRQMAGSHVILSLPAGINSIHDVPDRSLEEAAAIAAYYSRGRDSSKVEVDYTFRHQVQKPPGAKPGMVIYHQYWTIIVDPNSPTVQQMIADTEAELV